MAISPVRAARTQHLHAVPPQSFAEAKVAAKHLGTFLKAKARAFDKAAPQTAPKTVQLEQMAKLFGPRVDAAALPKGVIGFQTMDAKRFFYAPTKIDSKTGSVYQGTTQQPGLFFGPLQ